MKWHRDHTIIIAKWMEVNGCTAVIWAACTVKTYHHSCHRKRFMLMNLSVLGKMRTILRAVLSRTETRLHPSTQDLDSQGCIREVKFELDKKNPIIIPGKDHIATAPCWSDIITIKLYSRDHSSQKGQSTLLVFASVKARAGRHPSVYHLLQTLQSSSPPDHLYGAFIYKCWCRRIQSLDPCVTLDQRRSGPQHAMVCGIQLHEGAESLVKLCFPSSFLPWHCLICHLLTSVLVSVNPSVCRDMWSQPLHLQHRWMSAPAVAMWRMERLLWRSWRARLRQLHVPSLQWVAFISVFQSLVLLDRNSSITSACLQAEDFEKKTFQCSYNEQQQQQQFYSIWVGWKFVQQETDFVQPQKPDVLFHLLRIWVPIIQTVTN